MDPDAPDDRTERFLAEIAAVKVRSAGRDALLLRVGAVMMPVGIVTGVVAWFMAHSTTNPLAQRDATIVAIVGVSVTVMGGVLFLRYSLAEFLRFWMARLLHQQDQAARLLAGAPRPGDASTDRADIDPAPHDPPRPQESP